MRPYIFWLRVRGLSPSDIQWTIGCSAKVYRNWWAGVTNNAYPLYHQRMLRVIHEYGGDEEKVADLWGRVKLEAVMGGIGGQS